MKCYTCETEMICTDDVNYIGNRIDFVKCPKCQSQADIIYGDNGKYIKSVNWRKNNE